MKQHTYTIIWSDDYYSCYLDQIRAENQKKAVHQWFQRFEKKTKTYGFTYDECFYLTKKMNQEQKFSPFKIFSSITEKPCKNVWGESFLSNPSASFLDSPYIYLIKNHLDDHAQKEKTYTFVLYYYRKEAYVSQHKASSVDIAFLEWKLAMLKKEEYHEMPKKVSKNFQEIMAREPHPPSEIVHYPNTWRWRFLVDIDCVTLYIIKTADTRKAPTSEDTPKKN
ncbi:MAG: hypothetical protein AAF335_03875 [Bacteroidota bacterium]